MSLCLALSSAAQPAPLTVLHAPTLAEAAYLQGNLILSNGTLYGSADVGGNTTSYPNGNGSVFKVNTDGSGFTDIHLFSESDGWGPNYLALSGNTLFGVTGAGGSNSTGVIFSVDTNGSNFTDIYTFAPQVFVPNVGYTQADGQGPESLLLCGNTLYGTTAADTTGLNGGVFELSTNGSDFTNTVDFAAGSAPTIIGSPTGPKLTASGNTLFGTVTGDFSPYGTPGTNFGQIFSMNMDGSGFTNLYSFTNGTDGCMPIAALTLSGDVLYGTTTRAGGGNNGTIFSVHTDGSSFTTLHTFAHSTSSNSLGYAINTDGAHPQTALAVSGNALFGSTLAGGASGNGTIFRMNLDGSGFTNLYFFTALTDGSYTNTDGAEPQGNLILCSNTLYGITSAGGAHGTGTIFSFALPLPQLGIASVSGQTTISWPGWTPNFQLQITASLSPRIWSGLTNGITFDGTNYNLTLNSGSPTAFFRLAPH